MHLRSNLGFFMSRAPWRSNPHLPAGPASVPSPFFGVCVASSEDAACDDYVLGKLRDLEIRCVRVDFSPDSFGSFRERFLRRLLDEGFQVSLHLVAPRADMEALPTADGRDRWRRFLRAAFDAFGGTVELFEIGTTVNRRRWSGFTVPLYLKAWELACEEAAGRGIMLAAPNVTDFEPIYNVTLLDGMRRMGRLPAIHTDNLYIERATEPETFDHKILGRRLAPLLKLNAVHKAGLLAAIGRRAGVARNHSTHVSWSLRRIRRVLEHAEEQQADYVARYCCLMAAANAMERVGPSPAPRRG
jgi:hypothetical protein